MRIILSLPCWSSLVGPSNLDENPCLGYLGPNMMVMSRGCLSLLQSVAAEEDDLVVGVNFISSNSLFVIAFVMYST